MTVSSDEEGWAHAQGYCAGWRGDPDEAEKQRLTNLFGTDFVERLKKEWDVYLPFKDKFHTDGHATSEEASACWDQYELDTQVRRYKSDQHQNRCEVCKEWTPNITELGEFKRYHLCDTHDTKEALQKVRDEERARRVPRR